MITLIHAKNKPYSTITTKCYVIYICLYQEHVFHGLFPKWQTLPIIRSSVHFCTFLTRKSLMLRFTFLSHPPKRFAPHAQWQTTGAGLDSGTEAACPRPHRDAPLPFGTKVLNAPLHAHGSSGFWAGSKRGAGPIVQHLQEPFVNSARHPPVPCQAQRAARTSCLHLLPTARQLAGGVEKPRAEAAALPEKGQDPFYSALSADLGWRQGRSGKHKLTTAPGAATLGKLCPFAACEAQREELGATQRCHLQNQCNKHLSIVDGAWNAQPTRAAGKQPVSFVYHKTIPLLWEQWVCSTFGPWHSTRFPSLLRRSSTEALAPSPPLAAKQPASQSSFTKEDHCHVSQPLRWKGKRDTYSLSCSHCPGPTFHASNCGGQCWGHACTNARTRACKINLLVWQRSIFQFTC